MNRITKLVAASLFASVMVAPAYAQTDNGGQPAEEMQDPQITGAINLSAEQESELRLIFAEVETSPITVDFDVAVGATVPAEIEFQTLPPRVVEVIPTYETYRYFMTDDGQIVIVAPDTREVVYLLAG